MGDDDLSSPATEKKEEARGGLHEEEEEDEKVLQFLDSLNGYIALQDSLSSTLRQGWLQLASARHSMGSSRISSALLDLKVKSAPTTLQISQSVAGSPLETEPHFALSKWASWREEKCSSGKVDDDWFQENRNTSEVRHRGSSHFPGDGETNSMTDGSPVTVDDNVQRERMKSLSVFGTLVSPKLRSAQGSFETALETIVEIANMRSMALSAFSQLQLEKECEEKVSI